MERQRYRKSVNNASTMPGADTDHNLVIMKTQIKLKFIDLKERKIRQRWNKQKTLCQNKDDVHPSPFSWLWTGTARVQTVGKLG